jgi:glutamine---fructose-6-phosphate transaminase (isomerizing)
MTDITHMRREIDEIPLAVARLLAGGRSGTQRAGEALRQARPAFLVTVARGSSDHAAAYLKYATELLIGIPVASVGPSVASVYHAPIMAAGGACLAISQSGKSPDILALMQVLGSTAAPTIALCNTPDAPLRALVGHPIDILAGPEHSVAATKSFVCSVVAGLMILAAWRQDAGLMAALEALPGHLEAAARLDWPAVRTALQGRGPVLVLGRGPTYAMACEAALKLKETCALHAEAYSCAEVMHGPVEMVDARFTALCLAGADAAEAGIAVVADQMAGAGANALVTSALSHMATALPVMRTGHALTDPLALIVTFYAMAERLSRALGRNPDRPAALSKVTQTV